MYYYLADKDIEGVYELSIPFEFTFISEWGDIVQPKFQQIGLSQNALQRTYVPTELIPCGDLSNEVFDDSLIQKIFVHHIQKGKKDFFGIYIQKQNSIHVFSSCPVMKPNTIEQMKTQFK